MPRHISDDSSDGEGIAPVRMKSNKENSAPAFALTAARDDTDIKPSKQQSKRTKAAPAMVKPATSKSSKRSKAKPVREQNSSDEEQQEDTDAQMRDGEDDEIIAETQQEEEVQVAKKGAGVKKSTKGASVKKDKVDIEADSEETPRERRLRIKLELSETKRKTVQELYDRLYATRNTKAEESEQQLMLIAAERQDNSVKSLELYKKENDDLRLEITELRSNGHTTTSPRASSRPSQADKSRVVQLEEQLAAAEEEKATLQAQIEEMQQRHEDAERKKAAHRDAEWEKELAKTVKAKDEEASKMMARLKMDLAQANHDLSTAHTELEAEIQHSKSLQAKLKNAPPSTSAVATGSSSSGMQKLADELETLKMHLALNEDLSGFSVVSVKSDPTGEIYNCIMSDCLAQTGSLTFKLIFYPDETVGYQPDIEAERDAALVEVLPKDYKKYMRFPADQSSEWFKNIFHHVNKLRVAE